jgi:hypothetical protein
MATAKTDTKNEAKTAEVVTEPTNLPAAINAPASTALAKAPDLPDYLSEFDGSEGKENIGREDLAIPRLALAQKMSPEIDPEQPDRFIEGLKIGDLFNTQTKEIYGPGPLEFAVLYIAPPKYIEFNSPEPNSGVKDMDVPHDDPRTHWTKNAKGESVKPLATKFYNFVIILLPSMELIGLSFKSTGLKTAKTLNTLITNRKKAPIYAGKYMLGTATAQGPKGPYKIYTVSNSNIPSAVSAKKNDGTFMPGWLDRELVLGAKEYFDQFKDRKNVVIDIGNEPDPEEDGPDRDPGM